ncbi:MAG: MurR/RpiR family transcriptional regulator [Candidatus Limnocylindria bacterium]
MAAGRDSPGPVAIAARRAYPSLSRKHQQLARLLAKDEPAAAFLSAAALGARVKADPATVVRFARAIGFDGYTDLQRAIRRRLPQYPTFLEKVEHDGAASPNVAILRRALEQDGQNLQRAATTLDPEAFSASVSLLVRARRIVVASGGVSQSPAAYLVSSLRMIGLDIREAPPGIASAHELAQLEGGDVVVAIGFYRYLATTAHALRRAKARSSGRIAITDNPLSPLAALAEHVLVVPVESTSHRVSLAAPMALVHALVAAVSARRHAPTVRALRRVDEEYRDAGLVLAE